MQSCAALGYRCDRQHEQWLLVPKESEHLMHEFHRETLRKIVKASSKSQPCDIPFSTFPFGVSETNVSRAEDRALVFILSQLPFLPSASWRSELLSPPRHGGL